MVTTLTLDKRQLREVAMDDRELMRELVGALITDTSRQVELLAIAVRECDSELCKKLAHYSKGACANVGAASAAELLKTIEQEAAARKFGECGNAVAKLAAEMDLLRDEVAEI